MIAIGSPPHDPRGMQEIVEAWHDLVGGGGCAGCGAPGRALCATCARELAAGVRPAAPTPCPPGFPPTFVAGEYHGALRGLVVAHKERGVHALSRPLGDLLASAITEAVGAGGACPRAGPVVLVPVPSRRAVVRRRGHDPLLRIVRRAAARCRSGGLPAGVVPLLRPWSRVADQAGLDAQGRAANLAWSMAVEPRAREALARRRCPVRVVVCDDVVTTGATLVEATRALSTAGVRVEAAACVAATIRHTPPTGAPTFFGFKHLTS